ncbi:type IV secretion system protein [Bartonella krasnovii]|uniref:Conjugal transfer protein n=1 Tax=Bartonella krasnovii TaxID=2267275 RepID=A0ABY3VWU5_9HYPH|nr:type IV secretion system protein [Bartonella krasnovii]UNF29010.1 conjugal transfer protein [Bartonella krasnovii]UNF35365.1 conjugal transfer protein [Bartonella krasnovii]UNF36994.1 conjugal transfer protein [Bartonella krasnovii]UNF38679.1 conjugal transfer protein [Bartonella krasnovii]UNF40408.1 conjugal transfer protein [Bartonella krasnovii]
MKKQVIAIAIAIVLGASNPVKAFIVGGIPDPTVLPSLFGWSYPPKKPASPSQNPSPSEPKTKATSGFIIALKRHFEQTRKIHESITGSKKFNAQDKNIQTNNASFFLKNPEKLYNRSASSALSNSLDNILKEEETPASLPEARDAIAKRVQYASLVDKAVSLKTFQEADNRFRQIEKLLSEIENTQDLKSITELQAHIIGMLTMLQNETAKLQMVAYLRNAEQSLIKQQKDKYSIKILNSKNTKMPTIRFIR